MPSHRARLASAVMKLLFRRRDWGDEAALTRRARRLVGAPRFYSRLRSRGLDVEQLRATAFIGELISPLNPLADVILYLHGGGYISGSAERHRPIASGLARRTRQRVFALDYRLAPEHRFPAALGDTLTALDWLRANSRAEKISIVGDSSGGGLALAAMIACREAGHPLPACAVFFSPWTDLTGSRPSIQQNAGRCALFHPSNIRQFAAAYLGQATEAAHWKVSPLFADLRGLPPILIQVSSSELLLDDSRQLHSRLLASGGKATLETYEDLMHCWQILDGLVPEATRALGSAAEFISQKA